MRSSAPSSKSGSKPSAATRRRRPGSARCPACSSRRLASGGAPPRVTATCRGPAKTCLAKTSSPPPGWATSRRPVAEASGPGGTKLSSCLKGKFLAVAFWGDAFRGPPRPAGAKRGRKCAAKTSSNSGPRGRPCGPAARVRKRVSSQPARARENARRAPAAPKGRRNGAKNFRKTPAPPEVRPGPAGKMRLPELPLESAGPGLAAPGARGARTLGPWSCGLTLGCGPKCPRGGQGHGHARPPGRRRLGMGRRAPEGGPRARGRGSPERVGASG